MIARSQTSAASVRRLVTRVLRVVVILSGWVIAIAAGLILLAWLTGRIASDRYEWSQWLAWLPTPLALIAAALGLLAAFRPTASTRRRRRRIAMWTIAMALLLINFAMIEHRLLRPAPETRDIAGIRLVHWNMGDTNAPDSDQFGESLLRMDGDITIVTNARPIVHHHPVRERLAGDNGIVNLYPITVLSKFPIISARHLVNTDGIVIGMVQVDTSEKLGRPIVIYLVDLPSNPKLGRMELARKARRLLNQTNAPPPDIAVGDFNITRGSASLKALFPGMRHAFTASGGHGYAASFNRHWPLPLYHIDHILLGSNLQALRYDLIDPGVSRHYVQAAWIAAEPSISSRPHNQEQ